MSFHLPLLTVVLLILGLGAASFAAISVLDGVRFLRAVIHTLGSNARFRGRALVLIPIRGLDPTLEEALPALGDQDHEDYRVLFITDAGDPSADRLSKLLEGTRFALATAKPLPGCSGKIAALLEGLDHLGPEDDVVVFADSDIVPDRSWLRSLLSPLATGEVAAVTGYRWYFPLQAGLGPALQSAWNSAAANVMFHPRWSYLWGGSYAIRRSVLEELDISAMWARALSDDMVMTQALRAHGDEIAFAPRATVANYAETSWKDVVEWTNRQSCLALLYNPAMRRLTIPYALHVGSFGIAIAVLALLPLASTFTSLWLLTAAALFLPAVLGLVKAGLRRRAFWHAMPSFRSAFQRHRFWFYLGTFLLPYLMLYNVRRATRMSTFTWRGKIYRFTSPQDIVVETER